MIGWSVICFTYFQVNSGNAVWKKEQIRHVTIKWTPKSKGELTSAHGTSSGAESADSKVCVCLTCVNIM